MSVLQPLRPYRRVPALIIAITLFAFGLQAVILYYVQRRLVEEAGDSLVLAATRVTDGLDTLVYQRYADMQILAGAPVFRGQDTRAMTVFLERMKAAYPVYQWLGVTDAAGRIIAATDPSGVGQDRSGTTWFTKARGQRDVSFEDAAVFPDSAGHVSVAFTAPIKGPDGAFLGVLSSHVALPVIEEIFVRTADVLRTQNRPSATIEWQLLTPDGRVIADSLLRQEGQINLKELGVPSALALFSGTPGYLEEEHLRRHVPVITGFALSKGRPPHPGTGWGVLIRLDRNDVLGPIWAILRNIGIAGVAVFLPMLILLLWASHRLRTEWARARDAEATLRVSYQMLHSTLDALSAHIAILDASGTIIAVNEAWRRFAMDNPGVGPMAELGTDYLQACESAFGAGGAEARACATGIRTVLAGERDLFQLDYPCQGRTKHYWFTVRITRFDSARVVRVVVAFEDITDRKLAEQALAEEHNRLAVTLRSIGDGVITTDSRGCVVLMNTISENLTGWTQAEAAGRPLTEVFHIINEQTRVLCENPVDKVLESGMIVGLANHTALIAKDGTERMIADSGAPIRNDEGATIGVVLVFRDITERVKLEQELLTARKLESIGVLAGGIAHDFNNILTAILGNLSLGRLSVDPRDELAELLSEAEKATLRARGLTQQLLTFAKGGTPVKQPTSLGQLVRETVTFVLHGANVRPEFDLPDDLWTIDADQGQLSQVIHNLVLNAQQAMPTGGVITLRAANITIDAKKDTSPLTLPAGPYVRLSVIDQGTGISENHLQRIFDPYFTTKQSGSGLGLSTAYSIVQKHGGHVSVESNLGAGSTFHVYLPATPGLIVPEAAPKPQPAGKGTGRILIMDDEEPVRLLLTRLLRKLGFDCDSSRHGTEAIDLYRRALAEGHRYDVVILDLTIPGGMGGKETMRNLRELDPQVKAFASSGYTMDAELAEYTAHGFEGIIPKPYRIEDMSELLDRALKGPRERPGPSSR